MYNNNNWMRFFVISRIFKVEVGVISETWSLRFIALTECRVHVEFMHFVLLAVSEETKAFLSFNVWWNNIIRFGFGDFQTIKFLVRVIHFRLRLQLITPTLTVVNLVITKTSCNNCLQLQFENFNRSGNSFLLFKAFPRVITLPTIRE